MHKEPPARRVSSRSTVNLELGCSERARTRQSLGESTVARHDHAGDFLKGEQGGQAQADKAPSEALQRSWVRPALHFDRRHGRRDPRIPGPHLAGGRGWEVRASYKSATSARRRTVPLRHRHLGPGGHPFRSVCCGPRGVLFNGGRGRTRNTGQREQLRSSYKTGTLTTVQAEVTEMVVIEGEEQAFLPPWPGSRAHSEHHIGPAIRRMRAHQRASTANSRFR